MTGLDVATLSPWAALVAGLAGSGHCLAMCGGIAGALAMRGNAAGATVAGFGTRLTLALAYNVSRVTSYAIAGAIAGLLGRTLLAAVNVAPVSMALRIVAGAVMIAAAGRLLFGWRLLDPLEAAGSGLWRKVLPWASGGRARGGIAGAIALGLAWGWLPCGLTYSMLLLAATTASVTTGALVMAAFGIGTLPAMVSATVAFDRAARALAAKATLRTAAGALLLAFGGWTAGNAVYHAVAHSGHGAATSQSHDGNLAAPGHDRPADHAGHAVTTADDPHAGHDMTRMGTTDAAAPADGQEAAAGQDSGTTQ